MESRDSSSASTNGGDDPADDPTLVSRGLTIADVLGVGGSAIVYRAHDSRHGRDVAIKILRAGAGFEAARERFAKEVRVAAGLRHPHILPLFDSGTLRDGRVFAVMPVAHGRPLRAVIDEAPLAVGDAIRLTREIAEALAYIHARGYVHRDIKPENILVEDSHAVLTDFGIATLTNAPPAPAGASATNVNVDSLRLTQDGKAVGTLQYISPEALRGERSVDGRTDVYALGLVLYEMLIGRLPFTARTPDELVEQREDTALSTRAAGRNDVPRELDAVIARATAIDPDQRFASARALADALSRLSVESRSSHLIRAVRDPDWRLLVLAAGLLLSIAGGVFVLRARRTVMLDPGRAVVADLANDTGDPTLSDIGLLAGNVISGALTSHTRLTVVNANLTLPSKQRPRLPPADSALARQTRELVQQARAGIVITGAYYRRGSALELVAEVTDTRSGRLLGVVGPIRTQASQPDAALRVIADSITAIVRRRYAPPDVAHATTTR